MREVILNRLNNTGYNVTNVQWIYDYCIYKGKTPQDTSKFIQALMEDPVGILQITNLVNAIIKTFKKELEIYTVFDSKGKVLFYY